MPEPQVIELWPCGYVAKCSAPGCRRRATTILRYLDNQDRSDHQADACDTHASELSACFPASFNEPSVEAATKNPATDRIKVGDPPANVDQDRRLG
jgi:hypothetical protein